MNWSTENLTRLRELHATGMSYSEIARQLGATRNEVCGKVWREGLGLEAAEVLKRRRGAALVRNARQTTVRVRPRPRVTKWAWAPPKLLPPTPGVEGGVALLDLEPQHCRWPVAGSGESIRFCGGGHTAKGKSYCAEHDALAYYYRRQEPQHVGGIRPVLDAGPEDRSSARRYGLRWNR
jgi:hypothetical protein